MDILNTTCLESNSQIKINFDGGDFSSGAVLLLFKEFLYWAGSWSHPHKVVFKIEKPYGQMIHLYAFVATTLEMEPYQVIRFYCGRGKMENFIKERKGDFDFASVNSSSKLVNANRLLVHALAYNLFNWFRRLAVVPTKENSMRHRKISETCSYSLNNNC